MMDFYEKERQISQAIITCEFKNYIYLKDCFGRSKKHWCVLCFVMVYHYYNS